MNNLEMAKGYFDEAKRRMGTAKRALEEDAYAYCLRQSQEAVELALKASLRLICIEPPKWHDVGPILIENSKKFPEWFKERIDSLCATSRWLRREREPSMYGDEESGLPPSRLYTKPYAERAVKEAKMVLELVERLLKEGGQLS